MQKKSKTKHFIIKVWTFSNEDKDQTLSDLISRLSLIRGTPSIHDSDSDEPGVKFSCSRKEDSAQDMALHSDTFEDLLQGTVGKY